MKLLSWKQLKEAMKNPIVKAIVRQRPNDILLNAKSLRNKGGFEIKERK
jgi:hypothetical protein